MGNPDKHEIPKTVRQKKVYVSSCIKKKEVGVWNFKGKKANSQENDKKKVNVW